MSLQQGVLATWRRRMAIFSPTGFLKEARRRRVFRVAALYVVGAWIVLQVSDLAFVGWGIPSIALQYIWIGAIIGFPIALVFGWRYDIVGGRIVRTPVSDLEVDLSINFADYVILAALALVTAVITLGLVARISKTHVTDMPPLVVTHTGPKSVAVLPFVNMSDDPAQQYFSDGITDELINTLARLPGLHVTARASSFQFAGPLAGLKVADLARQLGVTTLVAGSVRRSDNTVRVTAKLVNAEDGLQLWSESFDRDLTDIYAIQDEIATAVAAALQIQLSLERAIEPGVTRASSIDAYNLYLLGRYHFEKRTVFEFGEAQRYFENAIERDPDYAPAYNGLVDSILMQSDAAYGAEPLEQAIATALPLIDKSLELNPLLAETHASLGFLRMFEWDLLASEAALKRATELNPNLAQAYVWLYITYERAVQPRNAFDTLQRAFALDPLSPIVNTNMAAELWIRSRTNDALQAASRVIQIAPDGPLGYRRTARIKWTSGALAEAVGWYRQSIDIAPEDRNSKLELGQLLVDLGVYEEAESLLDDQRYIAYLAQGRIEEALAVVRTSLEERPEHLGTIFAAAHTEARAGNYDQVRLLLEPLAKGAETGDGSLFLRSGVNFWDPQIAAMDLVVALLETGDTEAGLALLSEVRTYFAFLRSEGLEHPMLSYQEARILALEGAPDEALAVLRQIIAAGWRFWYLDGDPALRSLHENQEFRSIVKDLNMFIEQETHKLITAEH